MERLEPDPTDRRTTPLDTHVFEQTREDYEFMRANGTSHEDCARRLDITVECMEKRLERHG